jgi:hypothetical protein
MVHSPDKGPTNKVHALKHVAVQEARRLSQDNPKVDFYVLKTILRFNTNFPVTKVSKIKD